MPSEWLKIRSLHGSQNHAFEELCCQLAEYEPMPAGSRFIRKGSPDAGVECFWTLPNGDEWGWQAKFFVAQLADSEWSQLDSSVKTALEKHPRLQKYTVCLPINFPDARIEGSKTALDKWQQRTDKWRGWAAERGMNVDFILWGESQIFSLLAKEEHRGRIFFWFNKEVFSVDWLTHQIEEASANAGPRYTPELNVELPIARNFDGLGRTAEFYSRIAKLYGEIRRKNAYSYPQSPPEAAKQLFQQLQACMSDLFIQLKMMKEPTSDPIPFDLALAQASRCRDKMHECMKALEESTEVTGTAQPGEYRKGSKEYRYDLSRLLSQVHALEDLLESKEAQLANRPALLIVGTAGIGKTHLLCEVAQKRLTENQPSIVLLGEQFTTDEPWGQIIKLVGLDCGRDDFLGALDSAGGAAGRRALLLIDALNEGDGNKLWPKHLPGMLVAVARYKHLGITITVRSSYESTIIPDGLGPEKLIRVMHEGFSDKEYVAMQTFFDYFGVEHPSVPLLAPEFQNPLFLKIFCQSLKNIGLTRIPPGLTGITRLLNFFLDSVNTKLSHADRLDFDEKDRPVHRAIEALTQKMAAAGKNHLSYEEARGSVNAVLPREGFDRSLFKNLVSEGVITRERILVDLPDKYDEVVRFAYERFTDHLIVAFLLNSDLNVEKPATAFQQDSRLGQLFKDEFACWSNRGLLEAACVQVPERVGEELPDLLRPCAGFEAMRFAFVESIIWRDPKAVNQSTLRYINSEINRYEHSRVKFLEALLTVATYPEHPYNARFLHRHLFMFAMADRDAWWSTFVHFHYGEGGAIDRLIDWAWFSQTKEKVSDDSAFLAAVALAWFLTSSNRYLRDRATKALVALLTTRLRVVQKLVRIFRGVNDLYVAERIYCVAYGCALRAADDSGLAELANDTYNLVFRSGSPVPHVLLRDYARGVIEVALHRNITLNIDPSAIRPPYKTKWPSKIPTLKELEKRYGTWHEGMAREQMEALTIKHSVIGGDFGRYVIGTNFGRREFSSRRLGKARKPTYKERYTQFIASLTKRQAEAFRSYEESHRAYALSATLERIAQMSQHAGLQYQQIASKPEKPNSRALRAILPKSKYRFFTIHVRPYLENSAIDEQDCFDLQITQRWVLKRVLEFGWTAERFGRFDSHMGTYANRGREEHKAERIGKKYQWIAYHEFLAILLDNFEFKGHSWGQAREKYSGPWQLYVRDIDPSVIITKTKIDHRAVWWAPESYHAWENNADDKAWVADPTDLPSPERLLEVTDPRDGSRWLTLGGSYFWEQPTPPEEERYEQERREIWNQVRTYLTRAGDKETVFAWAKRQESTGHAMPENGDLSRVFLGEFPWAESYRFHESPYYSHEGWTQGSDQHIPAPILSCADAYRGESSSLDCSVSDTIHITLPVRFLVEGMGLHWNGLEGSFSDTQGRLIAFDPSVKQAGPRVLLIREEPFLEFLNKAKCNVFWMFSGEKRIIGGRMSPKDWKGRLELSGAFRRSDSGIEGCIISRYKTAG